jgi:hypothetical protein
VKLVGFQSKDKLAQVGTISITKALTCVMIGGSRIVKLAEISLGIVDRLKVIAMSVDVVINSQQVVSELENVDYLDWLDTEQEQDKLLKYPSVSTKRSACIPPGYDDIQSCKSIFAQ